jgi:hypothetical protein
MIDPARRGLNVDQAVVKKMEVLGHQSRSAAKIN